MNDVLKYFLILLLILFSFYYTKKVSDIIINNSYLMKEINDNKDEYEIKCINAVINDKYIIPGINGKKVNSLKSYYQMKDDNLFNKDKFIYDEILPDISINNNKNLIINKGNTLKRNVTILLINNNDIIDYSLKNNINITRLITYDTFDKKAKYEQINYDNSEKTDILLSKYQLNKNVYYVSNIDDVINNDKYKVYPNVKIDNINNYNICSGDIILISDYLKLENFKILINNINFQDLKIVYLSDLISEKIS